MRGDRYEDRRKVTERKNGELEIKNIPATWFEKPISLVVELDALEPGSVNDKLKD